MIILKEVQMTHQTTVANGIVLRLSIADQMMVASHAAAPLGVAKWLVDNACPDKRLPLGRRRFSRPLAVLLSNKKHLLHRLCPSVGASIP